MNTVTFYVIMIIVFIISLLVKWIFGTDFGFYIFAALFLGAFIKGLKNYFDND